MPEAVLAPENQPERVSLEGEFPRAVARLLMGKGNWSGSEQRVKTAPYPGYQTLWIWLALGWVASGVDRTITGPVMTYMIDNKVPLLQGVENPFAVGGLVGSLLPCR